jgi:hypothetical protein
MKKAIPVVSGKKKIAAAPRQARADIGLTQADCICATMAPHCPVHATAKTSPAPGCDVVR